MKILKRNKTVKSQLYSRYAKAERKSLREVAGVWKLAPEPVTDLLMELLTEFIP